MAYPLGVALALALFLSPIAWGGQIGRPIERKVGEPGRLQALPGGEIRRGPAAEPDAMVDVIVEFREPRTAIRTEAVRDRVAQLRQDLSRLEGKVATQNAAKLEPPRVRRTFSRVLFGASARVPREMMTSLRALPYVAAVHVQRRFEPLAAGEGPSLSTQLRRTPGVKANAGAGVRVAVIDSGIDYLHPALGGGMGATYKVIGGWDFANDDADPADDHGHGTHVAGIIAADGDGLLGVAPGVSLVAYKVIRSQGYATEEDIIAAIERTVDPNEDGDPSDHLDIANLSLGGRSAIEDPVAKAVERATAAGVLFTIASGNTGQYGFINSPATAPSAISVGALDRDDNAASFSTRGPLLDYGIKPEIAAPGVDILSTIPQGRKAESSGTSMAAPYVAGVAALMKARHPEWTPAQVKAAVVTTARPVAEEVMVAGSGRADAAKAMAFDTLASPAVLSFGQDDTTKEVWSTTRTMTLRNLGAESQTLQATLHGLREGVAIRVTPDAVTLAPGQSASVDVELTVTNALVPAPRAGSLSYGGRIAWSGGATPIHLPWAFVKGAYLTVEEINGGAVAAWVFGESGVSGDGYVVGPVRFFRPIEKVDVVVESSGYPSFVAVKENVMVEGSPVVSVDTAEASLSVALDTTDENGQPLVPSTARPERVCYEKFVLAFPHGGKVAFGSLPEHRPRFTPFSSRVRLFLNNTCGDADTTTLYAALHPPLNGLAESVTSTLRPHWLQQDVVFTPAVGEKESMTGTLAMMRFGGPDSTYYYDGGQFFLMHETTDRLTIRYTASPDPEVTILSMLERWGRACSDEKGERAWCAVVDNVFLYLDKERVTAETDVFLDVSPMGYSLPVGETMTFGRAPVYPEVRFDSWASGWGAQAFWMGPLGERRMPDTLGGHVAVYDANGTRLAEGLVGFLSESPLPAGRYRIEATNPNLSISSARGKATFTGWVDTTRTDFILPMFTGLRVVDEHERQVTIVDPNTRPSLLFSVTDVIRGRVNRERVPPREEATRVEYRAHGTTEWRPLPATLAARHYPFSRFLNGGVGTMYRVDLGAVTSGVTGLVDVRILAEDNAGNTVELRLEPAFSVGQFGRRRAVRH